MRRCWKAKPSAKIKYWQYRLRGILPDEQATIIEFANDSTNSEGLNLLNLRCFDSEPKLLDTKNRDFLNIQSIHRKNRRSVPYSDTAPTNAGGYFGSVPSTPSIK